MAWTRFSLPGLSWRLVGLGLFFALLPVLHLFRLDPPIPFERSLQDHIVQLASLARPAPPSVVVLDIDDESLGLLGESWPISRARWAQILQRLRDLGASQVAFTVVFDQPGSQNEMWALEDLRDVLAASHLMKDDDGKHMLELVDGYLESMDQDAMLSQAIGQTVPVIMGTVYQNSLNGQAYADEGLVGVDAQLRSLAQFRLVAQKEGGLNIWVDEDGVARRYPVFAYKGETVRDSMAASLISSEHLPTKNIDRGAPLMGFANPQDLRRLSLAELLGTSIHNKAIKKIVSGQSILVGVTASAAAAQFTLPHYPLAAGVEIQALATDALVAGRWWGSSGLAAYLSVLWGLMVLGFLMLFLFRTTEILKILLFGLLASFAHIAVVLSAAAGSHLILSVAPTLWGVLVLVLICVTKNILELRQSRLLTEAKSEFVSMVSHELRTPLTSIRGAMGLLKSEKIAGELSPQATGILNIAHSNTERLARLVDDVLDLQKFEQLDLRLAMKTFDLQLLLDDAIRLNATISDTVCFELLGPVPKVSIEGDADRLLQVLSNFMSNAAKYSPSDRPVELSADVRDSWLRVCVQDYGPGIPEAFRSRVFEKFSQSGERPLNQTKLGGTGLGLSIAQAIVQKHGGRVGFESQSGEGSCFYFELPILRV